MRRFYDPQPFTAGQPATLGADASHHIARVLRMREGDPLVLFNGEGGEWQATLEQVHKSAVVARLEQFNADDRTPPQAVTLALPLIKGEKLDYAVQKATELGVTRIALVQTERAEVRLDGERADKKVRHLRQVAISACEQCGMNRVPELLPPVSLADWLAQCESALKLIAHPGEQPFQPEQVRAVDALALVTGPEGGFTDAELALATDAGFIPCALGERVLRAETAPVALLAAFWAWQLG
ncbi:16S rRNA (uracil(1498)-N(3))-methyltransferase [Isoalcanivorax beigongshangi]|uniref:Ribosomal RNA small subunit methyltransferase E n=1 Tax=Isoalcanivorax beigongshangi TaxID=3238810 RepID=A0ABV4AE47_9GAMM